MLILERGAGEREKNMDVKDRHQPVASQTHPNWGSNQQPFGVSGRHSNHLTHQAQAEREFSRGDSAVDVKWSSV